MDWWDSPLLSQWFPTALTVRWHCIKRQLRNSPISVRIYLWTCLIYLTRFRTLHSNATNRNWLAWTRRMRFLKQTKSEADKQCWLFQEITATQFALSLIKGSLLVYNTVFRELKWKRNKITIHFFLVISDA